MSDEQISKMHVYAKVSSLEESGSRSFCHHLDGECDSCKPKTEFQASCRLVPCERPSQLRGAASTSISGLPKLLSQAFGNMTKGDTVFKVQPEQKWWGDGSVAIVTGGKE